MCLRPMRRTSWLAAVVVLLFGGAATPAAESWQTLKGCRLVLNPANDGDSFHVRHEGQEHIFRLYFVDTPETDLSFPERVREQADYFKITPAQAVRVGKKAAEFTERRLGAHPLTVLARWEGAEGRSRLPRHYAFVIAD